MAAMRSITSWRVGAAARIALAIPVAALAVLLGVGSGAGRHGNATPSFEEMTTEAIAWVHRHGGALGDAAPSIELIERHRDELGVDWMLLRCSGDGRRTILERRTDGDRWWLHVEQESVGGDEEPRLSDVRSRSRWQTRPGIRTVTIPARSLRGLRDELQKWRQQASG
jgi:hypothetical protein